MTKIIWSDPCPSPAHKKVSARKIRRKRRCAFYHRSHHIKIIILHIYAYPRKIKIYAYFSYYYVDKREKNDDDDGEHNKKCKYPDKCGGSDITSLLWSYLILYFFLRVSLQKRDFFLSDVSSDWIVRSFWWVQIFYTAIAHFSSKEEKGTKNPCVR